MNQRQCVLIVGVEFNNQGAFLMMAAAIRQIRTRFNAVPVLEFNNGTETKRRSVGAYSLLPYQVLRLFDHRVVSAAYSLLGRLPVVKKLRRVFPWVTSREVVAVFDASGFCYGDQWVNEPLNTRASRLEYWKSCGVPVYLLPQAYGPFEQTSNVSLRALGSARMVMPRDPDSLEYVLRLTSGSDKFDGRVLPYPDFTVGLEVSDSNIPVELIGRVPIVPNWNILERSKPAHGEKYIDHLEEVIRHLEGRGYLTYGMCHEGVGDRNILRQLAKRLGTQFDFPIVDGADGVQLKALIAEAPFIVSGRYHAIVSALSQSVPAVMHGWSHKYEHLAAEYRCKELICDPLAEPNESIRIIGRLIEDATISARLSQCAEIVRERNAEMWNSIQADLASNAN